MVKLTDNSPQCCASFFQGVFATVFDPSQKQKRKKAKSDADGICFKAIYLICFVYLNLPLA